MNRWKAAAIHMAISLVLAMTIAALLYFLWFPSPYFAVAGASKLILILMGVDIGVGPLLTLVVASPRKPISLLKLDLFVIAAVQAIAFIYGIHIIAVARPVFVVAAIDRFELISANELTDEDLAQATQPQFRTRSWAGPILVGVLPSKNYVHHMAEQALSGGKDMDQLPRFYLPYEQVVDELMKHARSPEQLKNATDGQRRELERLQRKFKNGTLLMLPMQRGNNDYTAIISPITRRPVSILEIDPW